ncbi:bis(5'-nucleosyl)-tetraphosphatase (symmetrical) YqeK [Alkalibacillus salilacus]|uniref:bis(5'-nucleosyl)-tetraphosphatase (symmetrical) n=1 Tax=Alkalibacillus salilacus TaxID=284582 RepID=A0ABT9VCJ8_9BACI|nr:bis(5'-nucleosyl)-tetraphosphatase (symmetrical) YqeK [Alkalibacillus salilacus]MDQ0158691.1 putative HD superfamily hydrolase involved in NAD metabolism [Alkalibacillus salilacus]
MNIEQALAETKKTLSVKRYEHVERVTETALDLADYYDADRYKVGLAAALHDYAKHMEVSLLKHWIVTSTNLPKDLLQYHHELWHGPVGAEMVRYWFQVKDKEVLNAIKSHTTGHNQMSLIEKIIFIADYIEPGRNFEAVHEARRLAKVDLNQACHYSLQQTIFFLMSQGQPVYPDTFQAYNGLTKLINQNGGYK